MPLLWAVKHCGDRAMFIYEVFRYHFLFAVMLRTCIKDQARNVQGVLYILSKKDTLSPAAPTF